MVRKTQFAKAVLQRQGCKTRAHSLVGELKVDKKGLMNRSGPNYSQGAMFGLV